MTAQAPAMSGHCEAAPRQANPSEAHARCRLEGCSCACHKPPEPEGVPDNLEPAGEQLVAVTLTDVDGRNTRELELPAAAFECDCLEPDTWHTLGTEGCTRALEVTVRGGRLNPEPEPAPFELTAEERARVIAAHSILHPGAALEVARSIAQERMMTP